MTEFYTPKEASEMTGASRPAIRTYTNRYSRYFSTDATPEAGKSRRLTADDVKVIAFIRYMTKVENATHDETLAALVDGALDDFEWTVSEEQEQSAPNVDPEDEITALVPAAQMRAALAMLEDARRREQEALQLHQQAQSRIEALQAELGEARGELKALRVPWWKRLLGIYE